MNRVYNDWSTFYEQIEDKSFKVPIIKQCKIRGNVDFHNLIRTHSIHILKFHISHKYT